MSHTVPQEECHACPPPSIEGEPLNPCEACGNHVNPHILETSPECPHGWEAATPSDLAEVYMGAWSR